MLQDPIVATGRTWKLVPLTIEGPATAAIPVPAAETATEDETTGEAAPVLPNKDRFGEASTAIVVELTQLSTVAVPDQAAGAGSGTLDHSGEAGRRERRFPLEPAHFGQSKTIGGTTIIRFPRHAVQGIGLGSPLR
jgi:hypothetical protein